MKTLFLKVSERSKHQFFKTYFLFVCLFMWPLEEHSILSFWKCFWTFNQNTLNGWPVHQRAHTHTQRLLSWVSLIYLCCMSLNCGGKWSRLTWRKPTLIEGEPANSRLSRGSNQKSSCKNCVKVPLDLWWKESF